MQELQIPKKLSGQRLDAILAEMCPDHSRAAWQKHVRRGVVSVNGKRVLRSNIRPGPKARLSIQLETRKADREEYEFGVVHEDDAILVLDKPAGLLTHAKDGGQELALADLAVRRFGRLPLLMGENRPGVVHRLDRETSGLIVLARTGDAMENLREQFRARSVRKSYSALVYGEPPERQMHLDWDIGVAAGKQDRMEHLSRGEGKAAETRVELVERLGACSLIDCAPSTGRRHQIRVHLFAAGLPIVGDKIYGARDAPGLSPGTPHPRFQCLHASRIGFEHPASGEFVEFRSELRTEMKELVEWLRRR